MALIFDAFNRVLVVFSSHSGEVSGEQGLTVSAGARQRRVLGSNPGGSHLFDFLPYLPSGRSGLAVERLTRKEKVPGSDPGRRTFCFFCSLGSYKWF